MATLRQHRCDQSAKDRFTQDYRHCGKNTELMKSSIKLKIIGYLDLCMILLNFIFVNTVHL